MPTPTKLSPEKLAETMRMLDEGKSVRQIARILGVAHPTILRALEHAQVPAVALCEDARMLADAVIEYAAASAPSNAHAFNKRRRKAIERFALRVVTWHREGNAAVR